MQGALDYVRKAGRLFRPKEGQGGTPRPPLIGAIAIEVRALSRIDGDRTIVDQIDLTIERGTVFCLIGPNGAGKTTTLQLLCGQAPRSGGSVAVLGFDPALKPREIKRHVAFMAEGEALPANQTARQYLLSCA